MKNRRLSLVALLCGAVLALWADSGIYVCGHFNRSPQTAVPALKQSGYTFGILFNINVEENGDITYEGQTVCRDGVFLLHETSPRFVDDVNSLISGRTSMARLEYCIGGWTNMAYQKITHLVRTVGTGEDSPLYKNFKALKEAIPAVIAVNNDIEHEYDAETQAQFHIMLYDLGFKTTIAPYMNKEYWERFVEIVETARPGAVERNYLQCYGGGAGNQPRDWNIAGLPIYGSWDLEANGFKKDEIVSRLTNWKNEGTIVGGFYWNYNTDRNVRAEAAGINEVFGGGEVAWRSRRVAMVYPVAGYKTPQTDFAMGVYSKEEIEAAGFNPHDVAAIRLVPGVKMTLYTGDDNAGDSLVITADTPDVAAAIGGTEYNSWTVSAGRIGELDGKEFCIRNKQSGLYLKPYSNKTTNGLSVRQRAYDGTDYMLWRFEAVDGGLYRIVNKGSGKTLQFSGESIYEGGSLFRRYIPVGKISTSSLPAGRRKVRIGSWSCTV